MSDLPFLPLWVSDYEAKTNFLTIEQDGAYMRLLRLAWTCPGGTLPHDDAWVMMRVRADAETFARVVKPVLTMFFAVRRGRYVNDRLKREYDTASVKTERRKMAGRKGGVAKALKSKESAPSNATVLPDQCSGKLEPYPYLEATIVASVEERADARPKPPPKKPDAKGTRLDPGWTLPEDWRSEAIRIAFEAKSPLTHQEISREADKFRDYWIARPGAGGRKLDWFATWRTWVRNCLERRGGHAPRGGGAGAGREHARGGMAAAAIRRERERQDAAELSYGRGDGGGQSLPGDDLRGGHFAVIDG